MLTGFYFISITTTSFFLISNHSPNFSLNLFPIITIVTHSTQLNSTEAMNKKFKKSQIMMLSLLASLLIITPLLSSSLRSTYYLYFVINILIIALAVESGLLSALSKPPPEDKIPQVASTTEASVSASPPPPPPNGESKKAKAVEKSASEKLPKPAKVVRVRKCPSTPSLFFIGSGETEATADDQAFGEDLYEEEEEEEEEVFEGLSGQELFTKAEMFIGNFYNQLKMQREESWKRIHGFYQKAF